MWRERAIIEWSWHVNSIVACCHSAKLCGHAARDFRSQQNGAVIRMWRSCQLHTKNVRSVRFVVKRRGCCCNLSGGVALNVWFTTDGMCLTNNTIHICGANKQYNRVIMACELYCCLLPQCEALRTCRSGFPIATLPWFQYLLFAIVGDVKSTIPLTVLRSKTWNTYTCLTSLCKDLRIRTSYWNAI